MIITSEILEVLESTFRNKWKYTVLKRDIQRLVRMRSNHLENPSRVTILKASPTTIFEVILYNILFKYLEEDETTWLMVHSKGLYRRVYERFRLGTYVGPQSSICRYPHQ